MDFILSVNWNEVIKGGKDEINEDFWWYDSMFEILVTGSQLGTATWDSGGPEGLEERKVEWLDISIIVKNTFSGSKKSGRGEKRMWSGT